MKKIQNVHQNQAICHTKYLTIIQSKYVKAKIGMCILELNKVIMYQLHCLYIKNMYGKKRKQLFTDTEV